MIHRFNDLQASVLLAFVRSGADAVFDSPDVDHHREPIKNKHADSKPGGSKSREKTKRNGDWRDEKKQYGAHYSVTFVNVSEAGNDAEQNRHRVACFWFGWCSGLARPIAAITGLCILGQSRATIRTRHRIGAAGLRLSWRVSVFHFVKIDALNVTRAP
jgi:hypothetical protein